MTKHRLCLDRTLYLRTPHNNKNNSNHNRNPTYINHNSHHNKHNRLLYHKKLFPVRSHPNPSSNNLHQNLVSTSYR